MRMGRRMLRQRLKGRRRVDSARRRGQLFQDDGWTTRAEFGRGSGHARADIASHALRAGRKGAGHCSERVRKWNGWDGISPMVRHVLRRQGGLTWSEHWIVVAAYGREGWRQVSGREGER